MKYRKKPIVVEAYQWTAAHNLTMSPGVHIQPGLVNRFYVITAHGQRVFLEDGDWVIAEPNDRGYYPCKVDIFAASYEPAG